MWNQLYRKHCSDEQLLAYADGELPAVRSAWVAKHLSLCWECRKRSHELEEQAHAVAQALHEDSLVGPERTIQARLKFLEWQQRFEQDISRVPEFQQNSGFSRRTGVLAFSCATLVLLIALGILYRTTGHRSEASEILARTEKTYENLFRTPSLVHQSFRVRVRQIEPKSQERLGQIEIWSDSDGQRFASRWNDSKGVLRHAVWRSGRGQAYIYNPIVAPVVVAKRESAVQVRSLVDLSPFTEDVEHLETGLMEWLETRDWRPIALSSDLHVFVSQDGAILQTEHVNSGICLRAERVQGGVRIKLLVELEANSYKPRLQTIHFEAQGRVLELELTEGECVFANPPRIVPAVFEPSLPSVLPESAPIAREPIVHALVPKPAAPERTVPEQTVHVDRDALVALEMEVRYALHRAKACLGEPVEIVEVAQEGSNHIEVRGVVETQARREELRAVLAEIPLVQVNIRTAEEELTASALRLQVANPKPLSRQESGLRLANRHLLVQPLLERYFANDRQANEPLTSKIAEFSTQAVSLSQAALLEAWALRRLADRYGEDRQAYLPHRSRWLLEVMVRDHITDLETEIRRTHSLLEPVLLLESIKPSERRNPSAIPTGLDWKNAALSLLEATQEIDSLVRELFAGADPPQPDTDFSEVERAVEDLRGALARLQSRFDLFETRALHSGLP